MIAITLAMASPAGTLAQDAGGPKRHFRIERSAELTGAEALVIYDRILADMVAGYRLSAFDYAGAYPAWRRFNMVPYLSAQHGRRYINNYANDAARDYRLFEDSGAMPPGAVLVKDSFAVTRRGDVFGGPLFVMEKMAPGFNPASHDWRYTMVMPDGSLFGTTKGEGAVRVEFCISCHETVRQEHDQMFYVPEAFRVRFLN